jgi:hypothetical protein
MRLDPSTAPASAHHIISLPDLRLLFLEIDRRDRSPNLSWIRGTPKIEDLYLHHRGPIGLSSPEGVRNLTVHVRQGRKAVGEDKLGEGSKVVRGWPEQAFPQ